MSSKSLARYEKNTTSRGALARYPKTTPCLTLPLSKSVPHFATSVRRATKLTGAARHQSRHAGDRDPGTSIALHEAKVVVSEVRAAVSAAGAVPRSSVAAKLREAQVRDIISVVSRRRWMLLRWWLISSTRKKGLFAALAITARAAEPTAEEHARGKRKTSTVDQMMAIVSPPPPEPRRKPKTRPISINSRPAWNASATVAQSAIERQPWKERA